MFVVILNRRGEDELYRRVAFSARAVLTRELNFNGQIIKHKIKIWGDHISRTTGNVPSSQTLPRTRGIASEIQISVLYLFIEHI